MTGPQPATSFGAALGGHELGRRGTRRSTSPGCWTGCRARVLDLAAGSGKLTRAVTGLGFDAVAVDPDEQMLRRIEEVPTPLQR